jgi:hypothetical protein
MERTQYIMVTNWEDHWDKLNKKWNNSTIFSIDLIKDGLSNSKWPTEAITLFIKIKKGTYEFEKCWIGKTKNFRQDLYKGNQVIRFDISDLKETSCPAEYKHYSIGWHLNKSTISGANHLEPAFFEEMSNCDPLAFEQYCFYLLRLLGIHDIHKFPQNDNRGKADGFFLFNSLAVIYDATLVSDYKKKKKTQVENYINQLKKEEISFGSTCYTLKNNKRQVWIITRGDSVDIIKSEDNIRAKEIPYTRLIEIYRKRLNEEIGIEDLCDILKDLK